MFGARDGDVDSRGLCETAATAVGSARVGSVYFLRSATQRLAALNSRAAPYARVRGRQAMSSCGTLFTAASSSSGPMPTAAPGAPVRVPGRV